MPRLNFPSNPTFGQEYQYGGATWIWNGESWTTYLPSDSDARLRDHTQIDMIAGVGLTGGGNIDSDRTFNLADTAVTPGTYGDSSSIPVITVDQQGRLTSASTANRDLANFSTTNLSEGDNLYYLSSRADSDFDVRLATKSTTNLAEGTNEYYTSAKVSGVITADVDKAFVDALNVDADTLDNQDGTFYLSWTNFTDTPTTLAGYGITDGYDSADWETHWGIKTTADLPENTNLYYTEGRVSANTDVAANTAARHTHANKAILDQIEQPFTNVDNAKLDGIDSGANLYVLPVATASLGGVVTGTDVTIDGSGNISVNNNSHTHLWSNITSTPTTIAGYGITDAYDTADFTVDFAAESTTNLPEGTNLYYTTARADSDARHAIDVTGGALSYDPGTGVITSVSSTKAKILTSPTPPPDPDSNELWWDTEVGELRLYWHDSDTAQWVDASAKTGPKGADGPFGPKTVTITFPTASEDFTLFRAPTSIAVQSIDTILRTTVASTVTYTVRYGSDRSAAGTEIKVGGIVASSDTTGDQTTLFDNAVIPSGSFVWVETSGVTGSVQEFNLTIDFA